MDRKEKDLEFIRGLEKLKASDVKAPGYTSPLDKDIVRVKGTKPAPDILGKIKNVTEHIDTKGIAPVLSGEQFAEKIAKARALKAAGKKALGIIPMAGTIGALMSGDPAMAAEEAASDLAGPAGMAYEAIKPETAGNRGEEAQMLAERNALRNYRNSPAYRNKHGISDDDAMIEEAAKPKSTKFSRLMKLFGGSND